MTYQVCQKCNNSMREVLEKIYKDNGCSYKSDVIWTFHICPKCKGTFCDCCVVAAQWSGGIHTEIDPPICFECFAREPIKYSLCQKIKQRLFWFYSFLKFR